MPFVQDVNPNEPSTTLAGFISVCKGANAPTKLDGGLTWTQNGITAGVRNAKPVFGFTYTAPGQPNSSVYCYFNKQAIGIWDYADLVRPDRWLYETFASNQGTALGNLAVFLSLLVSQFGWPTSLLTISAKNQPDIGWGLDITIKPSAEAAIYPGIKPFGTTFYYSWSDKVSNISTGPETTPNSTNWIYEFDTNHPNDPTFFSETFGEFSGEVIPLLKEPVTEKGIGHSLADISARVAEMSESLGLLVTTMQTALGTGPSVERMAAALEGLPPVFTELSEGAPVVWEDCLTRVIKQPIDAASAEATVKATEANGFFGQVATVLPLNLDNIKEALKSMPAESASSMAPVLASNVGTPISSSVLGLSNATAAASTAASASAAELAAKLEATKNVFANLPAEQAAFLDNVMAQRVQVPVVGAVQAHGLALTAAGTANVQGLTALKESIDEVPGLSASAIGIELKAKVADILAASATDLTTAVTDAGTAVAGKVQVVGDKLNDAADGKNVAEKLGSLNLNVDMGEVKTAIDRVGDKLQDQEGASLADAAKQVALVGASSAAAAGTIATQVPAVVAALQAVAPAVGAAGALTAAESTALAPVLTSLATAAGISIPAGLLPVTAAAVTGIGLALLATKASEYLPAISNGLGALTNVLNGKDAGLDDATKQALAEMRDALQAAFKDESGPFLKAIRDTLRKMEGNGEAPAEGSFLWWLKKLAENSDALYLIDPDTEEKIAISQLVADSGVEVNWGKGDMLFQR